jgi:hypothetical protein
MDRVTYQQAKREKQLATMRAAFMLRERVEEEARASRRARMEVLAELGAQRRAAEQAERRRQDALDMRDPEHPLYRIVTANNLGGREWTVAEIAALHPCGRFDAIKHMLGHNFSLDVKRAVALGATLNDLQWCAGVLCRYSPEAKARYEKWSEECRTRGQGYKMRRFIAIFSAEEI